MPSKKLKTPLCPDRFYHIYNRGNNRERLFYYSGDYNFFLSKVKQYLAPYAEVYAYCLLPNHFHLLIKTGNEMKFSKSVVPNQLRKVFICYTKRINYMQRRTGGLFTKNYQRIEVKNEKYLHVLVYYIHKNPRKHGVQSDFTNYSFSSYKTILSEYTTRIQREQVLQWYGGKKEFVQFHKLDEADQDFLKSHPFKEEDDLI